MTETQSAPDRSGDADQESCLQWHDKPLHVISPPGALGGPSLAETRQYLGLMFFFVWRNIRVRYKQTVLGIAWAVLQPLATALVFTFFFGHMVGIESGEIPYLVFAYSGMLTWTFFSQGISSAAESLIESANLVTKVYFPRVILPAASILSCLLDFLIATPLLIVLLVYYRIGIGTQILVLPLVFAVLFIATTGFGLFMAAANAKYRDIRYVIPFLVQLWLFVTPVIYPASTVVPRLQAIGLPSGSLAINPMTGVVEGFRWALFGGGPAPWSMIFTSLTTAIIVLVFGVLYFRRVEQEIADVV